MSQEENYSNHYRTLGLKADCSWNEVRSAYRRKAHIWHPDRLPDIANIREQAEEKFKEVNNAFHALSSYHRRFGRLPKVSFSPENARKQAKAATSSPQHTASNHSDKTDQESRGGSIRSVFTTPSSRKILITAAVLMIGYGLWWPTLDSQPKSPPASLPIPKVQPKTVASAHLIRYGSTVGEVYEIQGTPSRTEGSVWFYGRSKIMFDNGTVTGWEESPETPLKTSGETGPRPQEKFFKLGSSKEEVRTIQGNPIIEKTREWDYGLTKVYFDRDRVSGWKDSDLAPLKVAE